MRVLVVGGGGREHALVWKLAQSPRVERLFCAPGNAGIEMLATCVPIRATDMEGLLELVRREKIDLTVVGPEGPLAAGIVDRWESEGLKIFGPERRAAALEASKVFAKEFLQRHGIPTARAAVFSAPDAARAYVRSLGAPCVVKADGLAAGKGVVVAATVAEAERAIEDMMVRRVFGAAGEKVLIEEKLEGEEASVIALTDGRSVLPLLPAQDHKAVYDGDQGPNTGGMGAYAPAPVVGESTLQRVCQEILEPVVRGLAAEGVVYRGALYAGLMLTKDGPKVLEFNVRFGDPETQPLLYLLQSDLLPALEATREGRLDEVELSWHPGAALCVVLAAAGYPGAARLGDEIQGLEELAAEEEVMVFHAGTKREDGRWLTAGGRVLNVTARGRNLLEARERAYQAVKRLSFAGMHYRRDIGLKALKYLEG
ncbi:phosphoribosylamine--glycine ligase [Desulfothermobacter acidiphilus]|uniref:phosphoribosylamine--glycine ligase n=1 Tax=Desulfothermobacter acidiphilus TaxID=1938353 RepID=UPI003F8ABD3F